MMIFTAILMLMVCATAFFSIEIIGHSVFANSPHHSTTAVARSADNSPTTTTTTNCLDKAASNLTAQQECVKNTPVINGCNNTQTVGRFTTFFNNISRCPVKVLRVALIEPTFTYAAYRNGSFYNFYEKYSLTDKTNKTITSDL